MDWKDIDTFPDRLKDGTNVLFWVGSRILKLPSGISIQSSGYWCEGWYEGNFCGNDIDRDLITHYMEIVPPKKKENQKIMVDINS